MNEKIIIRNKTSINTSEAMRRIAMIIDDGKTTGRGDKSQYCYAMSFTDGIVISCTKNKGDSFTFHVYKVTD